MSNRAVFFDRDGTLIEHFDYLTDPNQVELLDKAPGALKFLKERGFILVMVTNQSGVARGKLSEKKLKEIHSRLESQLAKKGAYLDRIYYCPYHPDADIKEYRVDSDLRKPQPGMLQLAQHELDIDLSQSWMIGDDDRDILAGKAAGCRTIMMKNQGSPLVQKGKAKADYQAVNLQEAANIVAHYADEKKSTDEETTDTNPPKEENNIPKKQDTITDNSTESKTDISTYKPHEFAGDVMAEENNRQGQREVATKDYPVEPNHSVKPEHAEESDNTRLLSHILRELKKMSREQSMGAEFSIFKLMAGVVQMVVVLCLVMAFLFAAGAEFKGPQVNASLLAALVFQTMVVALLMISKN